ncbi:methyl-accepting chemotaxis protein [Lyngbya aestuarii]|uniref:methyl-accepting chemotaxis protein n=1 Tax=Lyngbya aestuarii TaxID=118322 RepID=UPI00403DBECE
MFTQFFRKIQNQLLLLLLLSTIIPISIVGSYGIYSSTKALADLNIAKLENQVANNADEITDFLKGISNDVLFLSKTPQIQGIIQAEGENNAWIKQLQSIFSGLMEVKPQYMQLRYLDEKGQEIVRVDSDGTNVKVIPEAELQNKADRPYFSETIELSPEGIYISPVNLNQERGAIEEPYKPVVRYGTPIFNSSGNKKGIVIANVFANEFIKPFKEENVGSGEEKLLINQDGYYIAHPNAEKEWGFDLKKEEKLDKDYPANIADKILNTEQGLIDQGLTGIVAYQRVNLAPETQQFLVIIDQIEKKAIFGSVNSFKLVAGLIILVSLATVLPLGIFRGRQLVNLIKQVVSGISTSSQQIFSTLEQQERVASQQAASVSETTTTMDELEASCRQAAEQARAAAMSAQQVLQMAEGGTKAVGETLEGMFNLEQKVGAIAEQIVHLSEQANQIGNISQLVSDLANQTNMLALNSSVEAVRAGEHGKGFSVVANEIRKLADQSQKSAEKISNLVFEIQNAINSTVMVTEEGTKTVKTGVQIAKKTDQAFSGVADAVNNVVLNNQQISLNLKQQVDAMQQVVEAMDTINKGSKETATGIHQTKLGTQQLKDAALTLKRMV